MSKPGLHFLISASTGSAYGTASNITNMKKSLWILVAFAAATLLLYYPTSNGGFAADFVGWKDRFDAGTWSDLPNCFGYNGLHQFFHLFFYSFYKAFEINGLWWYVVFSIAHAFNGWLLFLFLKKLLFHLNFSAQAAPALIAAVLFLLCPYQSEVLVWKVCFHYLLSTGLILGCLYFLLPPTVVRAEPRTKSKETNLWFRSLHFDSAQRIARSNSDGLNSVNQEPLQIGLPLLLFALSLFVLEISVIVPLLVFCLLLIFRADWMTFVKTLVPFFAILIGYFLMNKMILGGWVGHYGAERHLNTDFLLIFGNEFRYFLKYAIFSRYLPGAMKTSISSAFSNLYVVYSIVAVLLILAGWFLLQLKKLQPRVLLMGVFFAMFLVAIVPIANLYHAYELTTENDRYGYLASAFFYAFLVVGCYGLPQAARYVILGIYLIIGLLLTENNVQNWHHANRLYHGLLEDYRWDDSENVYVLAVPDNYEGIFFFKNFEGKNLMIKEALNSLDGRNISGDIIPIGQFAMRKPTDRVEVSSNEEGVITVKFSQWGNWWMRNSLGTGSHETDLYQFKKINNGYELRFKEHLPKGAKLIYCEGAKWRELDYHFPKGGGLKLNHKRHRKS